MKNVAPRRDVTRFWLLMFGACAAPLAWLGHVMLGYGVSAAVCYRADHPQVLAAPGMLIATLIAFDAVALLACAAGAWVSWSAWKRTKGESRTRFLALWGIMSSLWFFIAILFNVIASVAVPPCFS